jgi:hypothetical protein
VACTRHVVLREIGDLRPLVAGLDRNFRIDRISTVAYTLVRRRRRRPVNQAFFVCGALGIWRAIPERLLVNRVPFCLLRNYAN